MTKFRFLALFAALALLFIVSTTVLAQAPKQPHVFTGEVMVGDEMAMEDTEVTAMIDGETVGMAMVMDGMYTIKVDPGDADYSGKMVMFMVGMENVEQSGDVDGGYGNPPQPHGHGHGAGAHHGARRRRHRPPRLARRGRS